MAVVGLTLLVGGLVALAGTMRDTDPPKVYLELLERVPAGEAVGLFVSVDEPVTLLVEYGDEHFEEVTQETTFALTALAGVNSVKVTATDGAGNSTEVTATVTGAYSPTVALRHATELKSGDPLGVRLELVDPAVDASLVAQVVDVLLTADGETVPIRPARSGSGLEAVLATPLVVNEKTLSLEVTVVDEFGRATSTTAEVALTPLPVEVEQLNISAATLALVTPEGRELEAAVVAEAWASAEWELLFEEPFMMPIEGVHTSGFADARRYAEGGAVSFHYGLDLAAPLGTDVRATNRGRVLVAGHYPIKGGFVMLDHGGGLISYYLHLSKLLVSEGQLVERGQVIAEVGSEGLSTGPHLHWEMRVREGATNPLAWVDRLFPGVTDHHAEAP